MAAVSSKRYCENLAVGLSRRDGIIHLYRTSHLVEVLKLMMRNLRGKAHCRSIVNVWDRHFFSFSNHKQLISRKIQVENLLRNAFHAGSAFCSPGIDSVPFFVPTGACPVVREAFFGIPDGSLHALVRSLSPIVSGWEK